MGHHRLISILALGAMCLVAMTVQGELRNMPESPDERKREQHEGGSSKDLEIATFANGCFWCTEAVFEQLRGVSDVVSGYIGGKVKNPTYEQVCSGMTGHAEAVQVTYDPNEISYSDLLHVFWKTHDPTTLNRQGHDVGTQYRSAVFFHNEEQRTLAEKTKQKLSESKAFDDPIVTEITEASKFYPAEAKHQDFYRNHPDQGYCSMVIRPKLDKFQKAFSDKLEK